MVKLLVYFPVGKHKLKIDFNFYSLTTALSLSLLNVSITFLISTLNSSFFMKNSIIFIFRASATLPRMAIVICLFLFLFSMSHIYWRDTPERSARSCWVNLCSNLNFLYLLLLFYSSIHRHGNIMLL